MHEKKTNEKMDVRPGPLNLNKIKKTEKGERTMKQV